MKPSMIKPALRWARGRNRAIFLWGPPGVGKSDLVDEIAREDKIGLVDFRLAMRDPTDIKGFPIPDMKTKRMVFLRDAELPSGGEGILFMDELNSAKQATQAAAMQLTLTRRIGDYVLPPGWSIVGAGNRETDRGVVERMPSPLANRFVHIDYEVSLDDWCAWALANGVSPLTVAFLRFRPHLLHAPDYSQRAFSTPRSNVFADEIVSDALPRDMEYELLKGTVGEGHAGELTVFARDYGKLPTFEDILRAPDTAILPDALSTLYGAATMVGARATKKTFDKLLTYIERMPVEFQIVAVRDALRQCSDIAETAAYIRWGIANASVTM